MERIEDQERQFDRREFLRRGVGASVTALAAIGGAAALYEGAPELVTGEGQRGGLFELGRYDVARPSGAVQLAIVHGDEPVKLLEAGVKALGGIESFIEPGDVVVVKPNVAFASPALIGATANPEVVAAVVRLCLGSGAARVIVTDNPIHQPERCFAQTGIGAAVRQAGGEVFVPTASSFAPLTVKGGELIRNWPFLYKPFEKATKVIGVAPVKDHSRAKASMCMKNWYGLLGGRRNQFHQDINNIIKELAMMMTPTLVVLDGTRVMMRHGPTGGSLADIAAKRTLMVSTDQVAADAVGYTLLERDPAELAYLEKATALKLGNRDYKQLEYVEFNV